MVVRAPDHSLLSPKELLTFRLLAVVAAVAVVAFGFLYQAVMDRPVDPWALRLAVAAACASVIPLSFAEDQRWFTGALNAVYYILTGWITLLVGLNGFAAEYALGLFTVVAVISTIMRSTRALLVYGTVTLAGVAIATRVVESPRLSPALLGGYLFVILLLVYTSVRSRLRAADELALSEERYALAAHGANDGLWDWDLLRGTIYLSPRWKAIIGCGESEIADRATEWFDRIHPEDRQEVQRALFTSRDGEDLFESEHRIAHRDGSYRWVRVRGTRIVDGSGAIVRMAGSQTDITLRRMAEEQLVHGALHDRLTGLPNRALFIDRLERAIAHARRDPDFRYAVVLIDLDRFSLVNDRFGHAAADGILRQAARRLQQGVRDNDTVARLGKDEFAVILVEHEHAIDPMRIAGRLQQELGEPYEVGDEQTAITASLGVASSETGFERAEDVIRDADSAMQRAKALGRARIEVVDDELHAASRETSLMERELRDAVAGGQLRLCFQPIVVMKSRALVGFEALVRWQHPVHGLRSPDAFITLAEQSGIIHQIGQWVLEEGCRHMMEWRAADPAAEALWLSVNLSSRQFLSPNLVAEISTVLGRTGFPASRLKLEMTESVIMHDPAAVGAILRELRALGIRVAIDDFGTGYSSLASLHTLPVDTLKIDRSFVRDMHGDPTLGAVIQTVISLSGRLRLETVAEGVETDADAAVLRRMGCRLGQGFLYAHPLTPVEARELISGTQPIANRVSGGFAALTG